MRRQRWKNRAEWTWVATVHWQSTTVPWNLCKVLLRSSSQLILIMMIIILTILMLTSSSLLLPSSSLSSGAVTDMQGVLSPTPWCRWSWQCWWRQQGSWCDVDDDDNDVDDEGQQHWCDTQLQVCPVWLLWLWSPHWSVSLQGFIFHHYNCCYHQHPSLPYKYNDTFFHHHHHLGVNSDRLGSILLLLAISTKDRQACREISDQNINGIHIRPKSLWRKIRSRYRWQKPGKSFFPPFFSRGSKN